MCITHLHVFSCFVPSVLSIQFATPSGLHPTASFCDPLLPLVSIHPIQPTTPLKNLRIP